MLLLKYKAFESPLSHKHHCSPIDPRVSFSLPLFCVNRYEMLWVGRYTYLMDGNSKTRLGYLSVINNKIFPGILLEVLFCCYLSTFGQRQPDRQVCLFHFNFHGRYTMCFQGCFVNKQTTKISHSSGSFEATDAGWLSFSLSRGCAWG